MERWQDMRKDEEQELASPSESGEEIQLMCGALILGPETWKFLNLEASSLKMPLPVQIDEGF